MRSRALWRHHTEWEKNLDSVWYLIHQLRKQAGDKHLLQSGNKQREYSENYIGVALWVAFNSVYIGKPLQISYKVSDDQRGVACGDYKIELSAAAGEEHSMIEEEHTDFTHYLAELKLMKDLSDLWKEVERLQEQMQTLINKALRSNDMLYECKFCRHLWK